MPIGRGHLGELRLLRRVRLLLPVRTAVLAGPARVGVRVVRALVLHGALLAGEPRAALRRGRLPLLRRLGGGAVRGLLLQGGGG
ncbi:hypothetical protein, partial [Streptomyces albidoflavus]|uniref:hypothetical protein n=3 Tax=Streptomyces albidoflavus TaxID=1886 RepID=UPI001C5364D6